MAPSTFAVPAKSNISTPSIGSTVAAFGAQGRVQCQHRGQFQVATLWQPPAQIQP